LTEFFNLDDLDNVDESQKVQLSEKVFEDIRGGKIPEGVDEQQLLIIRYIDGMKMREWGDPTIRDINKLNYWYERVIMEVALLESILDGDMFIDFDESDTYGKDPLFTVTQQGREQEINLEEFDDGAE